MINIGKVVNTHGIKGEIRILSDFKYKEKIFKKNNIIYINNKQYIVNSYRVHKNYDMLTLKDVNSIDDATNLKNNFVFIDKTQYDLGIINEDLIGLNVYDNDIFRGKVVDVINSKLYDLLVVQNNKRYLIPNIDEFIKKIDIDNNKIYINYIKGLEDEN